MEKAAAKVTVRMRTDPDALRPLSDKLGELNEAVSRALELMREIDGMELRIDVPLDFYPSETSETNPQ